MMSTGNSGRPIHEAATSMRIEIDNLPPIASGSFDLRPLTIFIGPNNTGKTRAGLLAYALTRALEAPFISSAFPRARELFIREPTAPAYDRTDWQSALQREFESFANKRLFDVLPERLSAYLDAAAPSDLGSSSRPLLRFQWSHGGEIRVTEEAGLLRSAGSVVSVDSSAAGWLDFLGRVNQRHDSAGNGDLLPDERYWSDFKQALGLPARRGYYLPSGRSAFAESWGFLTGLVLDRGGNQAEQGSLSPRVLDYLRLLLSAAALHANAKPGDAALLETVDYIERHIMHGRVTASGNAGVPFPLLYSNIFEEQARRFTIDLSRASSSVNEVGPMAMILRAIVKPGDLVVIDEPEAHLHPENQRRIARALLRTANAGVTVIAPTHSHTIIHEVSDVLRAGRLDEATRERLGYHDAEQLSPADVGVYVFQDNGDGVRMTEIEFDEEFGYPEETFYEVAREQMLSSHRIDLATAPAAVE